jgi:hypothetical protein
MILGGCPGRPHSGAWVAFLSSIERRELESQPWYGSLANHGVLTIAAVMGGRPPRSSRGSRVPKGTGPPP